MDISARLRKIRESQNMSMYRLAKVSGVSSSFISRIESENRQPTTDVLERLCKALGITMADFFAEDNRPLNPDRIDRLTPKQRQALNKFLETMEEQ